MDIESVKRKYEEQLLRIPNVNGVGIGEKSGRRVIKVFVDRKLPESALQPEDIVPKSLDGWETEVEEIGVTNVQ